MVQTLSYARLPSRAVIAVGGADWRDFLHNLISQSVETLAVGEIRFGALLTPQGKVFYDLFVIGREDGCWLDVAAEHRDAILQRLMIYRLRAKVTLAPDEAEDDDGSGRPREQQEKGRAVADHRALCTQRPCDDEG